MYTEKLSENRKQEILKNDPVMELLGQKLWEMDK